jgi:hypothetical protein
VQKKAMTTADELCVECPVCANAYTRAFWLSGDTQLSPGYCLGCGEMLYPDVNVHIPGCIPLFDAAERALLYIDERTGEERTRFSSEEIQAARLAYKAQAQLTVSRSAPF